MTALRIADEFGVDIIIEHCTEGHKIAAELGRRGAMAVVGPTMTRRSKVEVRERSYTTLKTLWEQGVEDRHHHGSPGNPRAVPDRFHCLGR